MNKKFYAIHKVYDHVGGWDDMDSQMGEAEVMADAIGATLHYRGNFALVGKESIRLLNLAGALQYRPRDGV